MADERHPQGRKKRPRNGPPPPRNREELMNEFNPEWIRNGMDEKGIEFADKAGKKLSEVSSSSQIRNFFGEVKRIQMKGLNNERNNFHLLRPKLAYAAKRSGKGAKAFQQIMDIAHQEVKPDKEGKEQRFQYFIDLLESILAYHKVYSKNQN